MIACPRCKTVQPAPFVNTGRLNRCPSCGARLRADVFNAFFRPPEGKSVGETVTVHGQAECFYHPGKRAVVPCADCGRLLCALCDVEFNGRHVCLTCLQAQRDKKKTPALENQRLLYDSIALALAVYPMLLIFPTLVTGPATIYVVVRYWKQTYSLVPRTRIRSYAALLLAGTQITVWAMVLINWLT